MPKFELTYHVNSTETVYVDAPTLTNAMEMVTGDEPQVDLKVITNLQFDAELVSIKEVGDKINDDNDLIMKLAIENDVYTSEGTHFAEHILHNNIVKLCNAYLKAKS